VLCHLKRRTGSSLPRAKERHRRHPCRVPRRIIGALSCIGWSIVLTRILPRIEMAHVAGRNIGERAVLLAS
jgi:hypothetical protein